MLSFLVAALLQTEITLPGHERGAVPAELEVAARDYRIQVYETYRSERSEFDHRSEEGRRVLAEFRKSGGKHEDVAAAVSWFKAAAEATRDTTPDAWPTAPEFSLVEAKTPKAKPTPESGPVKSFAEPVVAAPKAPEPQPSTFSLNVEPATVGEPDVMPDPEPLTPDQGPTTEPEPLNLPFDETEPAPSFDARAADYDSTSDTVDELEPAFEIKLPAFNKD